MALLLLVWGWAGAHGITFSHLTLRLEQAQTQLSVQLPVSALLNEQPSPLPAGTTAATLRQQPLPTGVRAALSALVTARLQLTAGRTALPLTVISVQGAGSGEDVTLALRTRPVPGALTVRADLFPGDALHKVFVDVYRAGTLAAQYALDHTSPGLALTAPEQPLREIILTFVREGVHHIFTGPDHILFVLALILLGGPLRTQIKIITAFTVSHSVTLTLATLGVVQLPARLVESVIALSIVVVGLHDLRQLRQDRLRRDRPLGGGPDLRVLLAATFGLIHGFGFASVLSALDLPRQALAWSLASFNLGVELGQVIIVLLATPVLLTLRRYAAPRVVQGLLSLAACGVILMGGVWLVQRVFNA